MGVLYILGVAICWPLALFFGAAAAYENRMDPVRLDRARRKTMAVVCLPFLLVAIVCTAKLGGF